MINSMTGFGRGEAPSNGITVTVEVKSVNSRYLNINLRLPQLIQEKELKIKELIQQKVSRGKVNITLRVDKSSTGEPEVTINPKLVKGYKKLLENLREVAGISEAVSLDELLNFEEIFVAREEDEQTLSEIWDLSRTAIEEALDQLVQMRRKEGSQLENDLEQRVDHIHKMIENIQTLTEGRADEARQKLMGRIQSLVDNDKIDPDRLEQEVAIIVDKMDITEELVRLRSHLKYFKETMGLKKAVGRRLNFLSQEINREINTIGSKANNSEISKHVVQAKESLEQIREQVQNIE